jgi:alpha-mannosidase
MKQKYTPANIGAKLGPTWSSHWFKLNIDIDLSSKGKCVLIFDTGSEALIWSVDGEPLQGLTGGNGGDRHVDFVLVKNAKGGEHIELYIGIYHY